MQIQENISLRPYNTFRIDVLAKYFTDFANIDELGEINNRFSTENKLVLGGGSNILFVDNFDGIVLKNEIKGIEVVHEDTNHIYVKAGGGENWHEFVQHCVSRDWAGVENLSLIPGCVGASPIQNIGAYGVELDDVFWDMEAWHLKENKLFTFTRNDCEFGYRDSVFKKKYKSEFAIVSVTFQLKRTPVFHTSYGAINAELEKMRVSQLSIQSIAQAVINIRSSKLPDPHLIPNAGSFFKNPEVDKAKFEILHAEFPSIVSYSLTNGNYKLAAGWMIEQCGWKGKSTGDAGCHEKQALVLVNYGNATGKDIYYLSEEILQSVKQKFDVELEREVNIIPPVIR